MATPSHPLSVLDRLVDEEQGDSLFGTPLIKYRETLFSQVDADTLFTFIKDSHEIFVGPWDSRRNVLIHQIIKAVLSHRGLNGTHLTHLNLNFAFFFDEDKRNLKHPYSFLALHELMHAKMDALWPKRNTNGPSAANSDDLIPVQPQLHQFQEHAQNQVRSVCEQASKSPQRLKALIQSNERDPYLSHKELIGYLMPYGVTEDQVLAHVSQTVKRQHLEGGLGL